MEETRLNFEVKSLGDVPLVEAEGDIDLWSAEPFVETIKRVIESDCEGLILDLRKVNSMDAGAIRHLVEFCKALGPDRKLCAIAGGAPERLIKMARMDSRMKVCSGLQSAKESVCGKPEKNSGGDPGGTRR